MELRIINKLALTLLAAPCLAWAASSDFVVQDIRVEGLQRVDLGTVYNDLPIKIGDDFHARDSGEIIRQLFKSGSFSNITLARDGNTLVVIVHERPTIGQLSIVGNDAIKTEDMLQGLHAVGVAEGLTYVPAVLEQVKQELLQQYYAYGQYGVEINLEVEELPRNRVGLTINIDEGAAAKIRNINIIGNKAFSTRKVLKQFGLTTPNFMTWFTKNDQYSKVRLTGDLENLRSFYLDRGYLKFDIVSTQVSIVPSKEDIYLTINLHEGDLYTVTDIQFSGEMIGPESDYRELIVQEVGELYSRKRVTASQKRLVDYMGRSGYAFAEVNPVPTINEETKTVTLTFYLNPKKQVYVRHINFAGNYLSKDEILRRAMTQLEGALSSTRKIDRSRNNLNLLGYFKDVSIEPVPVPGTDDQIDLEVKVTEQLSGQLTGGVGYSQVDGILFNVGIKQDNFLGTGNMVDFLFNRSKAFTSYKIGYNDPYYTPDGVSRGFNVFYQATDMGETEVSNYTRDIWGGGMDYGIPLTEVDRLTAGIGYENVYLKTSNNPLSVSEQVEDFVDEYGNRFNLYRLSTSWSHNTLNRAVFPSNGLLQSISGSLTVPLSDLDYYKLISATRYYYPINSDFTLMMRGNVAYGDGYINTHELPIFENYYAGGSGSVRGFRDNSLGPLDSKGDPLGGNFRLIASGEVYFPIPYLEIQSIRTSVFIDAGNVYNTTVEDIDLGTLRYSTGVSLQWLSPMGPFVFSLAKPLTNYEGDITESFQFNIGSMF
jgi:outer membrane protein insertion porin family